MSKENSAGPLREPAAKCCGERPATVLATEGVPLDRARVDVEAAQVLGDRVPQGAPATQRALAAAAAYRRLLGALRDVGTLVEHRPGERHDLLDGRLGGLGHRLGRLAGTDAGLDVSRANSAVHLNLQLAEAGVLAAQGGPE